MERLQRVIASRGISSRRAAEELITAGRVTVDGEVVTELGTRVNAVAAEIRIDGKLLKAQQLRTIVLNKPAGYITTMSDERDRRTVMDLIQTKERLFPVGRLDRDTEGLLLFTNDGELANRITHPRYQLAKEYHVVTTTRPSDITLQRVRDGVRIDGRLVVPDEIRLLRETREGIVVKLVIHEGFYHAVRRLMDAVNIPVKKLRRHRIGPISIQGIEQGEWRDLTVGEQAQLATAVHLDRDTEAPAPSAAVRAEAIARRRTPRAQEDIDWSEATDRPRRPAAASRLQRNARPAATGSRPISPAARPDATPGPDRPARPAAAPGAGRKTQPVPDRTRAASPAPAPPKPPAATPPSRDALQTVGGRQVTEVTRTFRSTRSAAEIASRRQPARQRPGGQASARAADARRPGESDRRRTGGTPPGGQRPGGQQGPARDDERRPAADALDTVGRRSRYRVKGDDPDATPTRIKRRSPHPHSHRGRKPTPKAPRINTTQQKASKGPKSKRGGSRGRRR